MSHAPLGRLALALLPPTLLLSAAATGDRRVPGDAELPRRLQALGGQLPVPSPTPAPGSASEESR